MSNYGIGTISPGDDKILEKQHEGDLEQEKVEAQKERKIIERTDERLRELVPSDDLYDAMENFLLGDPENQIGQLGNVEDVIRKGDDEKSKGQNLMARAQYETAAKIAIYNMDSPTVKNSLELASSVTDPADKHAGMQKTILGNLNEVVNVSKEYYKTKRKVTAEEEAKVEAVEQKPA